MKNGHARETADLENKFGKIQTPESDDLFAALRNSISADLAVGSNAIDEAAPPDMVVTGRLPVGGANLSAPGGASKTTLALNEYVHIIGGGRLYGEDVIRKGKCVLVTAEDGAAYPRYLLRRVLEDGLRSGALPANVAQHAKTAVKIVGWSRSEFGPMAIADGYGNVHRARAFDILLELLAPHEPAVVTLDPGVLFSPGERFGNDCEAFMAAMFHEAALKLKCMFQVLDHVSQSTAKTGEVHQHAARGGTAKTDNARLARQLVRFRPDSDATGKPLNITDEDVAAGRILQLHWTKFNYAPIPPFAWLRRSGYWIETLRAASSEQTASHMRQDTERERTEDEQAVLECIAKMNGTKLSKKRLEDIGVLRSDGKPLPRVRLRGAVERLLVSGKLALLDLPKDEIRGAAKHFLSLKASA